MRESRPADTFEHNCRKLLWLSVLLVCCSVVAATVYASGVIVG